MLRSVRVKAALACLALAPVLLAVGCSGGATSSPTAARSTPEEKVRAAREKLSAADRAAVEEQEWCVVQTDQRLGSMGPPHKVMVKNQTVFLCCDHCEKQALADPDKTLATLEAHKKRVKEQQGSK